MTYLAPEYLKALIADEAALGELLGYYKISVPLALTPICFLYPTQRGISGRLSAFPLPRWRRDWAAAGPLVGQFGFHIEQDDEGAVVRTQDGQHRSHANFTDHPDKDFAIRAALVRAAIECLAA